VSEAGLDSVIALIALVVLVVALAVSRQVAREGIADDCDAIGSFRVDAKAYTCAPKGPTP